MYIWESKKGLSCYPTLDNTTALSYSYFHTCVSENVPSNYKDECELKYH